MWFLADGVEGNSERLSILFQLTALFPFIWLFVQHLSKELKISNFFSRNIHPFRCIDLLLILLMVIMVSFGADNLMSYFLSLQWPDYIESNLAEDLIPYREGSFMIWLTVFLAVIIGPIMEEIVFRGLILQRFAIKYGASKAIVLSSVIFGLLHAEAILGAAIFGVFMSVLYLHTKNLWVPIGVHIINNLLAVVFAHYMNVNDPYVSLSDYRSDLPYFLLALGAIPGVIYFLRNYWIKDLNLLPYRSGRQERLM